MCGVRQLQCKTNALSTLPWSSRQLLAKSQHVPEAIEESRRRTQACAGPDAACPMPPDELPAAHPTMKPCPRYLVYSFVFGHFILASSS